MSEINNRYDFLFLHDVTDGNPNGDPDTDNSPRVDPETGQLLLSDVSTKRKIRNYLQTTLPNKPGNLIYIREKAILSNEQAAAYQALDLKDDGKNETITKARDWMCKNFVDIRFFGAVMSLKNNNAGQVQGPLQITFSRSIDPATPARHTVTRVAVANEEESKKQHGANRTMGSKWTVPYALFRGYAFLSPARAKKAGFTEADLKTFLDCLPNLYEHDRSAARGLMSMRQVYVFKHDTELGNAPAFRLFELVSIKKRDGVEHPRAFSDYEIKVGQPPEGVTIHTLVK